MDVFFSLTQSNFFSLFLKKNLKNLVEGKNSVNNAVIIIIINYDSHKFFRVGKILKYTHQVSFDSIYTSRKRKQSFPFVKVYIFWGTLKNPREGNLQDEFDSFLAYFLCQGKDIKGWINDVAC